MVNIQAAQLDLLFYALSDSTRRQIMALAGRKAHTITELAKPFKMSLAAVSKHIKILEDAKLLIRRREGRIHFCTLDARQLKTAEACIKFYTKFWNQRLDLLAQNLEAPHGKRK
ncbi:MAG: metalloregulator ArsR/SmtB family transcription factor [Oligoflexia bacterium]|nr:metalloregulator ArsR/SmtB family transcription factor [Oligoflexia bacterium]